MYLISSRDTPEFSLLNISAAELFVMTGPRILGKPIHDCQNEAGASAAIGSRDSTWAMFFGLGGVEFQRPKLRHAHQSSTRHSSSQGINMSQAGMQEASPEGQK
jgi:hypothetical protein